MEDWKTDVQDWTRLNKDLITFYLSQAETHLKANIDLSDRITARATWLLSVIIPITALTTGYIFNQLFVQQTNIYLLCAAGASLFGLLMCLIILATLVSVRRWMPPGGQPKEILTSNMVDTELERDEQYVAIVLGEIERTQTKIDFTKRINNRRLNRLRFIIGLIVIGFFVLAIFLLRQAMFFI